MLVYPSGSTVRKPEVGHGLNRPATVTMYQCWPPPTQHEDTLFDTAAMERYRRKIQLMTERKDATFIDYCCQTGVWKFRVEHF